MAKRGRPRLNRPAIDHGTPELQAKRLFAIGPRRKDPAGNLWPEPDLTHSENALGVLLWRGELAPTYELAKRMYDAGIMFAGWWTLCNPKTHPGNALRGLMPGASSDPEIDEARANLTAASRYLGKERAVLDAVINAAVFSRVLPRKMPKLRAGLCRLIEWREAQRKAA